jgi:hypothetical protein
MEHRDQRQHQRGDKHGGGRSISVPNRFESDDGSADQGIRGASTPKELTEAVLFGRVLVAVVANADEVDEHGADKSSHMSVVSIVSSDGRRGLLAFTGLDSLKAWNPQARPVPVSGLDAAKAAVDDGCEALVIDVAGPNTAVVQEPDLLAIAGIDPLNHAAAVLTDRLQDASVIVDRDSGRLRVMAETAIAQQVAAQIPARVLALVPEGIEVVPVE